MSRNTPAALDAAAHHGARSLPSPPTIVIVATGHGGHRLMYVRLLIERAVSDGLKVLVVLDPGAQASIEFNTHLSAVGTRASFEERFTGSPAALERLFLDHGENHLIFPDGDRALAAAMRMRSLPRKITFLVMRPAGQSPRPAERVVQGWMKATMRRAARLRGIRVFALSSAVSRNLSPDQVRDPVTFEADPDRATQVRESWDSKAKGERYWFGIVGAISERKNVAQVASALAGIDSNRTGLLLAGKADVTEEVLSEWCAPYVRAGGLVVRVDRALADRDFDTTILALDCVVVAHSNEGPSGILGKAAAAGTRVLAAGAQSLRKDIADAPELGRWTDLSVSEVRSAMMKSIAEPRPPALPTTTEAFADRLLDVT